jgi:hypothetical protein
MTVHYEQLVDVDRFAIDSLTTRAGFNASHSLGAMLFGAIYLVLALGHMQMLSKSPALLWLAVAGSLS